MTEWIDFTFYALQGLLFWVLLPRQGRQFGVPMIADRNPDWLAGHPEVVAYFERSTGFIKIWYAWAAISIAVLFAVRLGWRPFGGTAPSWEVLKDWHGLLMIAGMLGWFASALIWFRWLKRYVPLTDRRSATLRPRTTGNYLSLSWRVAVEILTVLHLAAWLIVGLTRSVEPSYWGKFAFIVAMTALFAAMGYLTPRRRPGYPDHMFGDAYRRVEIRVAYVLRLTPLIAGAMAIGEQLTGGDFDRAAYLLLVMLVSGLLGAFLFLRPVASGAGGEPPRAAEPQGAGEPPAAGKLLPAPRGARGGAEMLGTAFGSNMHDAPRAL